MATNIDYIFHPPIDVGVHSSAKEPVPDAPTFRDHLAQEVKEQPAEPASHAVEHEATVTDSSEDTSSERDDFIAEQDTPSHESESKPTGDDPHAEGNDNDATRGDASNDVAGEDADGGTEDVVVDNESTIAANQPAISPQDSLTPKTDPKNTDGSAAKPIGDGETHLTNGVAKSEERASTSSQEQATGEQVDARRNTDQKQAGEPRISEAKNNENNQSASKGADTKLPSSTQAEAPKEHNPVVSTEGKEKPKTVDPSVTKRPVSAKADDAPRSNSQAVTTQPNAQHEQKPEEQPNRNTKKSKDLKVDEIDVIAPRQSAQANAARRHSFVEAVSVADDSEVTAKDSDQPSLKQSGDEQPTKSTRIDNGSTPQAVQAEGKSGTGQNRLSEALTPGRGNERPQSPLTESQQSRLVDRVAKAFDIARVRGESSVRLRLTPPQLGTLQIELQVDRGSLLARLEVESQTAREALLDNLNTLRNRLAEQNIRVDQFDVDLLDPRPDEHWGQNRQQGERSPQSSDGDQRREDDGQSESTTTKQVITELQVDDGVIDVII